MGSEGRGTTTGHHDSRCATSRFQTHRMNHSPGDPNVDGGPRVVRTGPCGSPKYNKHTTWWGCWCGETVHGGGYQKPLSIFLNFTLNLKLSGKKYLKKNPAIVYD